MNYILNCTKGKTCVAEPEVYRMAYRFSKDQHSTKTRHPTGLGRLRLMPWMQSAHGQSCASQKRRHSRGSHRRCCPLEVVKVWRHRHRSAGTAARVWCCACLVWKPWKPAQRLPAGDLLYKLHRVAGLHASADHRPAWQLFPLSSMSLKLPSHSH